MAFGYIYITNKQQEILLLIYKFRFLNRIQIQTLLNHKDPKRINVWLKDLVEKKYLGRIYIRKIPENIKPAIYFTAINGIHFFERRSDCNSQILPRLKKEPYHSVRFRNHCIFLAQLYIDLLHSKNPDYILESFETKTNLADYHNTLIPFPDVFITLTRQGKRKRKQQYFLELVDEGTPRYYLRHRIKEYLDYFENHSLNTKVLLICPNELTIKFMERFIPKKINQEYYYGNKPSFSLSLSEEVKNKGLVSDIWITI